MSLKDFRQHLASVQSQYLEAKEDLKDFDEALKAGYITEEKLQQVKEDFERIDMNYQRLLYVDYLINIPRFGRKRFNNKKSNKAKLKCAQENKADEASVLEENDMLRADILNELKKIENEDKQK